MGEAIGQVRDPQPGYGGSHQRHTAVRLEAPLGTHCNDLVAIQKLPGFGALHQGLMGDQFLRLLRGTMGFDIARTRNQFALDGANAACNQVGVLQVAEPYWAVVALCDEINKAIAGAGLDMQPYLLSNLDLVTESFTLMAGIGNVPFFILS